MPRKTPRKKAPAHPQDHPKMIAVPARFTVDDLDRLDRVRILKGMKRAAYIRMRTLEAIAIDEREAGIFVLPRQG